MERKRLLRHAFSPFPSVRGLIPKPGPGWRIIKQAFRRPKPAGAPLTFEEACRRYRVTEARLQREILPALRRWRRTATVLAWTNIGLMFVGFALLHLNMVVFGLLAAALSWSYAFQYRFHAWQLERRELGGVEDFLADRRAFFGIFLW